MNNPKVQVGAHFDVYYGRAPNSRLGNVPVVGSSGIYAHTSNPLITHPTVVVGRKGSAGIPWLIQEPCHPSDTTFYLVPKTKAVSLPFVFFALKQLAIKPSDDVIPSLKRNELEAAEIPLLTIPEQNAIVTVLSKIQSAIEIQDKTISTLKELKTAIAAKTFREGLNNEPRKESLVGEIPESWGIFSVGNSYLKMNYGTSVRCEKSCRGFPVLRIPNIISGSIDDKDLKYAKLSDKETGNLRLENGDLLFVRTNGNKEYTGRCAVYHGQPANALFASYLIRVRLPQDRIYADYVQYFFNSVGRAQITSKANPAADGKFNIDTGVLKSLLIPIPAHLNQQKEILVILSEMDSRLLLAVNKRFALQSLFSESLSRLMTGRITVSKLLDFLNKEVPNVSTQ